MIQIVLTGMAPYFMHKCHPKVLFILANLSTAFGLVLIGTFIFLQKYYPFLPLFDTFSFIPVASVVITVVARSIGILPVLHSLMSEVFPTEIRTESIGIVMAFSVASGAVCMKFFPEMKNLMTMHGLFFFYGATGVISCFYGLMTIPDNRGKSLIKVEEMYEYENDKDKTAN